MLLRVVFLEVLSVVTCDMFDGTIERKINATLKTTSISDTALLLDVNTFVSYNGVRSQGQPAPGQLALNSSLGSTPGNVSSSKGALRFWPQYKFPSDTRLRMKMIDMMRQAIYMTSERMDRLMPILRKYENDPSFRMAFIFNRLKQILIDMRRVYTLAWRSRERRHPKVIKVYEQIFWYAHIVKKYFDVLYIVEEVIEYHDKNVKKMKL